MKLERLTQAQVDAIVTEHERWLETGGQQGEKAIFTGKDLSFITFNESNLAYADFYKAKLKDTSFLNTILYGATFTNAYCEQAYFYQTNCKKCAFTQANLRYAVFDSALLTNSSFYKADCSKVRFTSAVLYRATFVEAICVDTSFGGADCTFATFDTTVLDTACFYNTNLRGARIGEGLHIYQVENIGSRQGITYYIPAIDKVICGCWNVFKGGTLEAFKERVEAEYVVGCKFYKQYMAAIAYFESLKEIN